MVLTATNAAGVAVFTATHSVLPAGAEIYLPLVIKEDAQANGLNLAGRAGALLPKGAAKGPVGDSDTQGRPRQLAGLVRLQEGVWSRPVD